MATSERVVRAQLALVADAATAELSDIRTLPAMLDAIGLVVPAYYDAAGALGVAWYDELRDEARPSTVYAPTIIGDPTTDWIEREVAKSAATLDGDLDRMLAAAVNLAGKEVARGYRDTILGNTGTDRDAVGWSRVARPGACKFCLMLAGKGSVYRAESTAIFAAHTNCHCAAVPKFRNGERGPEADAIQYEASSRRPRSQEALDAKNARVRAYLNENYPDAPG